MSEEMLFHEALAQPVAERAAFLDEACAGHPELRAGVEALLAAHEAPGSLLDRPAAALPPTVDSDPAQPTPAPPHFGPPTDYHPASGPCAVIAGRYTLQHKLGEGGMGEVWVADQTEPVKRTVALKLIKAGMDSRAVLQRFEAERQALALMDHPNIARVLDGGLTPTGQPFFVMELVNGSTLTRFCDEGRLTPRARLQLFVTICQAVQHAHQKGIVHRDLKPSNILVTLIDGKPVPKVIDFGVAKATAGKLTDESLSTQLGAVVGTLEYMSPEQTGFVGEDIDTRADVYSLGVILYELLTGLRPLEVKRLKTAGLTEIIHLIREQEPPKPSTRLSTDESLPSLAALRQVEPKRLLALLRGELDWVVMKCLEKRRERRYETANALGREVQRYLADEPVEARPPSRRYRLGKFLRRHKGPVLAASLLLLALLGGIVGTSVGLIQAEARRVAAEQARADEARQRTRAEKARDEAREALDAMTGIATGDWLTAQKEITPEQKAFLTGVLSRYQKYAAEKADDEPSRAWVAIAASRVGFIEFHLGRFKESAAAFRLACDRYEKLVGDFPAVPKYRYELAWNYSTLGAVLVSLEKTPEVAQHFRKALALQEKLVAQLPAVSESRRTLAGTHQYLGLLLADLGKLAEAEEHYRKALAVGAKLVAEFPTRPDYSDALALIRHDLGLALAGLGKRAEAAEQYHKALTVQARLAARFSTVPAYRHRLAQTHHSLGGVLAGLGKRAEAEEEYGKAMALLEKLTAQFPASPAYRRSLADTHHDLGLVLAGLGKRAEAEEQYRKAMGFLEKLAAEFPAVPEYRHTLATTHHSLAGLFAGQGKRAEAERLSRKAMALEAKLAADFPAAPEYRQALARCQQYLGLVLAGLGRWAEAERLYRRALAVREKLAGHFPAAPERRKELACGHNDLANLLASLGKPSEAEAQYRKALALDEKLVAQFPAVPAYRYELAYCQSGLSVLLHGLQRGAEAQELLHRTLTQLQKLAAEFPADPAYRNDLARNQCQLGFVLAGLGKGAEAEGQYRKALAAQAKLAADFPNLPGYRHELARCQQDLGLVLFDLEKRAEADELHRKSLALLEKLTADFPAVPDYQVTLGGSYGNVGSLLSDRGQPGESLPWYDKAIRTLSAVYQSDRRLAMARRCLLNSHRGRALACDRLQKYAEADRDWDRVIELCPAHEQPMVRKARAASRANAGSGPKLEPALAAAEKRYRDLVTAKGPNHIDTLLARRDWGQLCLASGTRFDEGEAMIIEVMRALRDRPVDDAIRVFTIGLLRGCLAHRQQNDRESWKTFNTQAVLGGELLIQKQHTEAERLLRGGYEGLKKYEARIPAQARARLGETVKRLVQLYEATGKEDDAARWRRTWAMIETSRKVEKQDK
jgi:serine/threonine protein kinase/Flp pilus assembly protein TadD